MWLAMWPSRKIKHFLCKEWIKRYKRSYSEYPETNLKNHGLKLNIYEVETEDGYVLEIHRLVEANGKKDENNKNNPVVLLQHGMWGTSKNWLIQKPEESICLNLLKQGCDIWLGNTRGNTYSRKHKRWNHDDKDYWDFSFHEMGYYDLPAMIDFILKNSHSDSLHYIGHSQGSTIMFVMQCTRPEFNGKIASITGLAPVVYLYHINKKLLKFVSSSFPNLTKIIENFGYYKFGIPQDKFGNIEQIMESNQYKLTKVLAPAVAYNMSTFLSDYVKQNVTSLILGQLYAGATTKQLSHFGQFIKQDKFCQFDYGVRKNIAKYGHAKPPEYCLNNVSSPTTLFYSDGDWLTNSKDINKLCMMLPNLRACKKIPIKEFDHMDYLWSGICTEYILKEIYLYIIDHNK
ncbi:lipase 3-like [Cimex lectularius]|uniref:Lipase n=1 Tax=Cimex lectularius TaxID=79782 RepID=A0A8I6S9W2_CIMLE|nr:lipase 3-like [Cimex lectularius]